ncbi:MAG: hypothetical protein FJ102_17730 [Deltaproteobacteria bacterium]|nr:hypothetical protein [Deltaproteobacteria bacterium]
MTSADPQAPKPEVGLRRGPSWDELYSIAAAQQGCFTREQASGAGFSDQLLQKHLGTKIERLHRGIYRLTRFPDTSREQEDLVVAWLWSGSAGVLSHETALRLRGLSDALPSRIHLTLPSTWRRRRLEPPPGVRLYFADVAPADRDFVGAVPVTRPARTLNDLAVVNADADVIDAAARQAIQRGLISPGDILQAAQYLSDMRAGAWRVRPESVANLGGTWIMEVVSGTCEKAPSVDWRDDAEDVAAAVGGRLHGSRYFPGSRTMTIEFVWPVDARSLKPTNDDIRAAAAGKFGWVS